MIAPCYPYRQLYTFLTLPAGDSNCLYDAAVKNGATIVTYKSRRMCVTFSFWQHLLLTEQTVLSAHGQLHCVRRVTWGKHMRQTSQNWSRISIIELAHDKSMVSLKRKNMSLFHTLVVTWTGKLPGN